MRGWIDRPRAVSLRPGRPRAAQSGILRPPNTTIVLVAHPRCAAARIDSDDSAASEVYNPADRRDVPVGGPEHRWPSDAHCVNLADMGNTAIDTALDGLLDPLSRCLDAESARRVTELRIDPAVQSRIDELAERANNGALNEDERAGYEAFINAGDFISILKLKARRHLESSQR